MVPFSICVQDYQSDAHLIILIYFIIYFIRWELLIKKTPDQHQASPGQLPAAENKSVQTLILDFMIQNYHKYLGKKLCMKNL